MIDDGAPERGVPSSASAARDIRLVEVSKRYASGALSLDVLHRINLNIAHGEFVAIMGPSGSGKSTLLNIIGCLDTFDSGRYELFGRPVDPAHRDGMAERRRMHIGFVFQAFNLIGRMTALRNVELPLIYAGVPAAERRRRAIAWLERVGLGARLAHLPNQLSGGQQQRVAIARALVSDPELIIADEPTGAVDTQTGHDIMRQLQQVNREGRTLLMVTHEASVASYADRVVQLADGRLSDAC